MSNHVRLLLLATLIAGSSWILIPTQISSVPYSLSIGYRFIIAGSLILLYCFKAKSFQKIPLGSHFLLMIQGLCMYCIAHSLSYNATAYIPTGIIALIAAFIIVPNTILGTIVSHDKLTVQFVRGTFVSLIGIVLVFYDDLLKVSPDILTMIGFLLVVGSIFIASIGTILSKKMMREKNYPIMVTNGFAMLYGGIFSIVKHFVMGGSLVFDFSYSYVLPLLYLSIIVTPLVFGIYLKLAKEVSAGFAGYIFLFTPVLALNLSMFFEDFRWTVFSGTGTILVLVGGLLSSLKCKKIALHSTHHAAGL